jgi:serine O-acetyltransferase
MDGNTRLGRERLREHAERILETYKEASSLALQPEEGKGVPSAASIRRLIDCLFGIVYPGFAEHGPAGRADWSGKVLDLTAEISSILREQVFRAVRLACRRPEACGHCAALALDLADRYLDSLPVLRRTLVTDVEAAYDGDPAAKDFAEVILAYPGLEAITVYRLAHALQALDIPLIPRMMGEQAHRRTGIDIHPGAEIGERFFIDHGTGVVIGETAVIGRNVKIYQGVTLGALSFRKDERGRVIREGKRHPKIEDDVVIYAGATILGGRTVIGRGSVIGGNTWVTHSVPPGTRVINDPTETKIETAKEGTP